MVATTLAIEHSTLVITGMSCIATCMVIGVLCLGCWGEGGCCIISCTCTCVYVLLDVVKPLIIITSFELSGVWGNLSLPSC